MRVLLVEDEISISGFLKEGLEEEGFAVDTADNGKKGLEMALDYLNEYDIILLDWMVPGMSGIEICRAIRKENKETPIIFLTAKDTVDDTVFALETGANDYLKKPFAFEELLARMRVLLRNKKEKVPSLRQAIYGWILKPIGLLKIIFLLHSPRKNLHCWNICCAIKEKYADARALLKKYGMFILIKILL